MRRKFELKLFKKC